MPKDVWRKEAWRVKYGSRRSPPGPKRKQQRYGPREQSTDYLIRAGTTVEVRRGGTKAWRCHTTRKSIHCRGYAWRNSTHYGMWHSGFEIKIEVGKFEPQR